MGGNYDHEKFQICTCSYLILLLNVNYCFAETQIYDFYKEVNLVVGDKIATVNSKSVTMEQAAYVNNGRTMVPFRFLGESLGAITKQDVSDMDSYIFYQIMAS